MKGGCGVCIAFLENGMWTVRGLERAEFCGVRDVSVRQ